jgi:hypothetical protein
MSMADLFDRVTPASGAIWSEPSCNELARARQRLFRLWPHLGDSPAFHMLAERLDDDQTLMRVYRAVVYSLETSDREYKVYNLIHHIEHVGFIFGFPLLAYLIDVSIFNPGVSTGLPGFFSVLVTVLVVAVAFAAILNAVTEVPLRDGEVSQEVIFLLGFGSMVIVAAIVLKSMPSFGNDGFPQLIAAFVLSYSVLHLSLNLGLRRVRPALIRLARSRRLRRDPGAYLISEFGNATNNLCRPTRIRSDDHVAASILEGAAQVIGEHLTSEDAGDRVTYDWVKDQMSRRAAGVRQLKRRVYLPGAGEIESLAHEYAQLQLAALDSRWADIPEADTVPSTAKARAIRPEQSASRAAEKA